METSLTSVSFSPIETTTSLSDWGVSESLFDALIEPDKASLSSLFKSKGISDKDMEDIFVYIDRMGRYSQDPFRSIHDLDAEKIFGFYEDAYAKEIRSIYAGDDPEASMYALQRIEDYEKDIAKDRISIMRSPSFIAALRWLDLLKKAFPTC